MSSELQTRGKLDFIYWFFSDSILLQLGFLGLSRFLSHPRLPGSKHTDIFYLTE